MSRLAVAVLAILVSTASNAFAAPSLSVPEPSSLAIMAAGVGIAAILKRRKRK